MGYTQLSVVCVDLAPANTASGVSGNESDLKRVVMDEPSGRREAEVAEDHHKFASGEALQTS